MGPKWFFCVRASTTHAPNDAVRGYEKLSEPLVNPGQDRGQAMGSLNINARTKQAGERGTVEAAGSSVDDRLKLESALNQDLGGFG
jgi:hypothetical protein